MTVDLMPFLIITATFAVLRLLGLITWSWAWVMSPVWIAVAAAIVGGFLSEVLRRR